jgi:hypothetical protein
MKKLIGSLLAGSFLMVSSLAFAAEPAQLTASQMDSVTAGGDVFFDIVDLFKDVSHLGSVRDIKADFVDILRDVKH